MILKENAMNSTAYPIDYNNNVNHRVHSTIGYDHSHSHNPWEKPVQMTYNYHQTPYTFRPMSSASNGILSMGVMNKLSTTHAPFDMASNFNPSMPNLSRRHELTLPLSTSISSTSVVNDLSSNPFNYAHTTAHYHPSDFFFGWNTGPSLMRMHATAAYPDYSSSNPFPFYNPVNSSTAPKPSSNSSSLQATTQSINAFPLNNYPSFLNVIPPINASLLSNRSTTLPSNSSLYRKHSSPPIRKRPRLTAQIRSEILKLKAIQPTVFIWEIQQILLQNGTCTSQTLPSTKVIQRVLNESSKSVHRIKEEPDPNVNLVMETIFNNLENKNSSPITICLSPSQSSTLSDGESASECPICLEAYRSGQEVSILSCSHEYHSCCIKGWMMKNRSCPMCRKDIHNQPQFVTLLI